MSPPVSTIKTTAFAMNIEAELPAYRINPLRVKKSATYRAAMARAAGLLKKPKKLSRLADEAMQRAKKLNPAPLRDLAANLALMARLVKAYARGDYRGLSWSSMVLAVTAIIYFVVPFDLIPDFIYGLGFLDDATILAWTIATLRDELTGFSGWEQRQQPGPQPG